MTSESLLKISRCEDLFPGSKSGAREYFLELSKKWHPDVCKDPLATEVFQHVKKLYDDTVERLGAGTWNGSAQVELIDSDGTTIHLKTLVSREFELGRYYIGQDFVTYVLDAQYESFYRNAICRTVFKFASPNMEKEMVKCLSSRIDPVQLKDGRFSFTVFKKVGLICLRDAYLFLKDHKKSIDPRHTAWIVSNLHNIACYLAYSGISHQEISLDTVFISPQDHSAALLGGWFYSTQIGGDVTQVSPRTYTCLPWEVKIQKKASPKTDLNLIRALGRELSGDSFKDLPLPMQTHFSSIATQSALEDYSQWRQVLEKSFGKRTFFPMDIDSNVLYRG